MAILTTAVYGDLVSSMQTTKLFTPFYLLFGASVFFNVFFSIGEYFFERRLR